MILAFPDFETLQLAVTSATLPEKVLRASAYTSSQQNEFIYVKSSEKLPRTALTALKQLGIKSVRKSPVKLDTMLTCWHQIISLMREPNSEQYGEKTTVLFVTENNLQLASLVSEMMRLGNDRQSFRYLDGKNNSTKALLRVVGPPYYSLLRAIDSTDHSNSSELDDSTSFSALAFVERQPRVWIQFGYRHPMIEQIQAPIGQQLLISADGAWELIDEAPFRDVYQALETQLPSATINLKDSQLPEPIRITLSLANAAGTEHAELWVLRDRPLEQVESLIRSSDDKLLGRLSFAVAGEGDDTTVIIRVRPSKELPPCLVLDAVGFRSYLKLPNLFLPAGKRLHPPLRRDAVAILLANESQQITWLAPDSNSNSFQAEQIDDSAFQPISNWVKYVMDRETNSLDAWSDSFQFQFESFICSEDKPKAPKPPRNPRNQDEPAAPDKDKKPKPRSSSKERKEFHAEQDSEPQTTLTTSPENVQPKQPNVAIRQLQELEDAFHDLDEPVDGAERVQLWRQMGPLNASLGRRNDATICWSNSFWSQTQNHDFSPWLQCEMESSDIGEIDPAHLKKLIQKRSNHHNDSSLVAAYLAWASCQEECPPFVTENLGELMQFMQREETFLPVRTAWIAWYSLYRLSDGDVLLLARARDRILERLFQHGLTPEFDMPSFLRVMGTNQDNRYNLIGNQLVELSESVEHWITEPPGAHTARSRVYAKLMFAFGLARLGESTRSREMLEAACNELGETNDTIHTWFAFAFEERIQRAINAESTQAPFSERLLHSVDNMERMDRYKIDRLRQQSRILEPLERINPFTRWHETYEDELSKQLAELPKQTDRDHLQKTIAQLLKAHPQKNKNHNRILGASLQLGPRTGEQFALELVDQVIASLQSTVDPVECALLLQKTMFVSAHYGRTDSVHELVLNFEQSLPKIVTSYLELQIQHNPVNKEKVDTIELLFTESFHGLRKLGMRDEIGRLYGNIQDLVAKNAKNGRKKRTARNAKVEIDSTRPLRLLLCVAGGWYYFGQTESANQIASQVREILFKNELTPLEQKSLATAYVKSIAMAPPTQAQERIAELFAMDATGQPVLENIKDNMTTSSHYSISQLSLVESTVMALVNDDYSLNAESRMWLDEDEFLVRSRIHQDVQNATA